MDIVLRGNLSHRFFFFEHLQGHLRLECRRMMFLLWHDQSSVTLQGSPFVASFLGPL